MAITLTSVNEQLISNNALEREHINTLNDVRDKITAMLKVDQDQLQAAKDARGDAVVAQRQASRSKSKGSSASAPMGLAAGFKQGVGITPLMDFASNAVGAMFGGALAGTVGAAAGLLLKKGAIAALVYNFADDAIMAAFKTLEEQGLDLDLDETAKKDIANRAGKGLTAFVLTGLISKNPFVKIATAVTTAYSDKIMEGIKLMFGVKTDENGKAIVNLPGMGDADLNDPKIQDSLAGIGTAVTLVTLGLLNRIRKSIMKVPNKVPDVGNYLGSGRGSVVEGKGARAAYLESLKPKGPSVRRVTKLDVERGLSTKSGAPAKVGQMTKLNTPPDLAGVGKDVEFKGKPWYKRMKNFNKLAKGLGVVGTAIDAYRINEIMNDPLLSDDEKGNQIISIIAGLGLGIAGGALAGAALGTVTGPWGTLFGGIAGGSLMALGGEALVYRALSDYVMGKDNVNQYEKMAEEYSKLMGPDGQLIPGYRFGAGGIEKIPGASGGYEYMMKPLSYPNAAPAGFGTSAAVDTLPVSTTKQRYHGVGSGRVGRGFVAMGDELSALDAIAAQREMMGQNIIGQVGDNKTTTINNSGGFVVDQHMNANDTSNGGLGFQTIGR